MRSLQALYLSNGLAVGVLYGFMPVLLRDKGFDPTLVGIAMSLGSVAYAIALPVWGHMGDIVSGPRRALQIACVPAALLALGLSAPLPVTALIVCVIVVSACGGPAPALTDAMTVPVLENASREYSRLRLLSSLGAAGAGIGCGFFYAVTGYVAAPLLYAATMAVTLISVRFVPLGRDSERSRRVGRPNLEPAREAGPRRFGSVGDAIIGRPRLVAVLIAVLLIFIGVMASATYIGLRIADLGGGPVEIGLANGLASLAEVPGLLLAGWLVARYGGPRVLAISSLGFAACLASWIVLVDAGPIIATRFASGICFGGIVVSLVLTIAGMLPAGLQATGQTLFQATGFGLAAILANLLGGFLYASAGPLGVFGGGALCAAAGGLIGLVALPRVSVAGGVLVPEPLAPVP